jgi:uncharacterized damage-inducible protein DinB
MNPEMAKAIAEYTLADSDYERATNKRVIGAIPAGQEGYAPSGKCMNALTLAWHIASAELFFLNGVCNGQFTPGGGNKPDNVTSAPDVIAWYDANIPPALEKARGLSGDQLSKVVDFFGMMQAPAVTYLTLMVKHGVHHRGQLSSYLRPMGAKVPGIYGPSGDSEPGK